MPPKRRMRGELKASPPEPWKSFLIALDGLLTEPVELHCIGGFVVTMQYGLSRGTADIDILPAVLPSSSLRFTAYGRPPL